MRHLVLGLGIWALAPGCRPSDAAPSASPVQDAAAGQGGNESGGGGTGGSTSAGGGTGGATAGGTGGAAAGGTGGAAAGGSGGQHPPNPDAGPVVRRACPTAASAGTIGVWENVSPGDVDFGTTVGQFPVAGFNIAVDQLDPATVYVAVSFRGVWTTTDCGANWARASTGRNNEHLKTGMLWTLAL